MDRKARTNSRPPAAACGWPGHTGSEIRRPGHEEPDEVCDAYGRGGGAVGDVRGLCTGGVEAPVRQGTHDHLRRAQAEPGGLSLATSAGRRAEDERGRGGRVRGLTGACAGSAGDKSDAAGEARRGADGQRQGVEGRGGERAAAAVRKGEGAGR